jgi:hypothetical protein
MRKRIWKWTRKWTRKWTSKEERKIFTAENQESLSLSLFSLRSLRVCRNSFVSLIDYGKQLTATKQNCHRNRQSCDMYAKACISNADSPRNANTAASNLRHGVRSRPPYFISYFGE